MAAPKPKTAYRANVRSFVSQDKKREYVVYWIPRTGGQGSYHVFMEVDASDAARDCDSSLSGRHLNTQEKWDELWKKTS